MVHLFINALAASAGGGLTYIRNVIPHFATRPDLRVTVALAPRVRQEFHAFTNINFLELEVNASRRFWFEQLRLPALVRQARADVLISCGNFAVRNSPVPQILLSRNSIYLSRDFYCDLVSRREYRMWLDTRLRSIFARRSVLWADATVAPSEAFASDLCRWTGAKVQAIHHGFDLETFTRDTAALPVDVETKLREADGSLKLLFVSHYNYYRNFETLIRALPLLRDRIPGRSIKLLLTCKLIAGENPGAYSPESAAKLANDLGVAAMIVELGPVAYHQLHNLYRRADVYVSPAYAETFAHPLVEAMASALPVIASDLAVHREICQDAAIYFPRFSPEALAENAAQVLASPNVLQQLSIKGRQRSSEFSWKVHVEKIIELAKSLA
jgi:glycosyltransferase involved in cell wall biosynthesis